MLQSLRIKNLALLEEVSLEFEPGFTTVTGETGAGKSILLGALSLLAGERADKTLIRQGAPACEVEAALHFKNPARIDALLAELELPPCEDGLLLLRRTLPRDKAPRLTVNGSLATLAALQRLGEAWIDFHGPSEPRRLLKENCQLELLDLYARATPQLATYQKHYRAWRDLIDERTRVSTETRLTSEQIAFLETQLAALDALDLTDDAIDTLERDFQRMTRAQELIELASALANGLTGEDGATARVAALVREARHLENLDPDSKPLADRLAAASIELADLGAEFESLAGELNFDPDQAAHLQTQMNTWLDARRRHGRDLAAVVAARDDMRRRLEIQGDIEGALARLDKEIAAAERTARAAAAGLHAVREKAARELAKVAARSIAQLGFRKADFQIRLVPLSATAGAPALGPAGDCSTEFLFSPNVGEPPLPLNRIASSGELARVMLALKTVLADLDDVPVLVFDEVDANVGGEIGRVVGEKMAGIAKGHQVLCVTHLPQVAAQGDSHLVVEKDQSGDRAEVTITAIHDDRKKRLSELARMLGDRTAKSALAHAAGLLGEN
ncbi:DNA repair protein RecN [Opitutaceae bacterium TAV5]|nr:DNA repair protein RecN [Opitutaceae bacterium TAV5]